LQQQLARVDDGSNSTTPAAGVESLVFPGSSWALLAWWIISNYNITARWLLNQLALGNQVIEDVLGLLILLQLLLHLHHLILHLVELLHLISNALFFDLGLLLLGSDLALGPSAFGADLEEIDAATMRL
jgi:hypothetical protein